MSEKTQNTMVQELAAQRARLLKDRTKTLQVPGWESLYVRYKRLPWADMKPLALAMGQSGGDATQEVGGVIDVLVAGCDTFLFKGSDGLQELGVRYEQDLANFGVIDNEAAPVASIVMSVFADDEVALMSHAGEYMQWATRQEEEADESLGKFSGGTNG